VSELPETKSEAVLPLIAGTKLIGVLDVQSTQLDAFSDLEINILNTLGSQVAISIQNARSFEETRQALAESEKIYQQFVQQGWKRISREQTNLGYRFSQAGLTPLKGSGEALNIESTTSQEDQANLLSIPIKLRGQTIGTMRVRPTKLSRKWDEGEMAMIQATVERAALALENARLLADSRQRASKERVISAIGTKITGAISIDNILKTAVEELGQAIPSAEVVIQFQNPESVSEPDRILDSNLLNNE
jgi:signal transduction protein with GAF and PtsI domain